MKFVIILLLSTTGLEEIKIKTSGLDCSQFAEKWREINTKYHDSRNKDPKQQGNYTPDGKLMIGYHCE
jgi:hypothetical protein